MGANQGTGRAKVAELLLMAQRPLTVQQVSDDCGLHVNTVREHLERLVLDGAAVRDVPATGRPGRPQVMYTAAAGADIGHRDYRLLAAALAEHIALTPAPEEATERVGRLRGRDIARVVVRREDDDIADVAHVHQEQGFAPELAGECVRMRNCPFLELAQEWPGIVCALHRGLVRGILEQRGVHDRDVDLRAFEEPGACTLRLPRTAVA